MYIHYKGEQMAKKIINNLDNEVWNRFVAGCRSDKVLVGVRVTEMLHNYNKNREQQDPK